MLFRSPAQWINAYDAQQVIRNEELYDLKAIPTLYLLGKNRVVELKDVTYPELAAYLENL